MYLSSFISNVWIQKWCKLWTWAKFPCLKSWGNFNFLKHIFWLIKSFFMHHRGQKLSIHQKPRMNETSRKCIEKSFGPKAIWIQCPRHKENFFLESFTVEPHHPLVLICCSQNMHLRATYKIMSKYLLFNIINHGPQKYLQPSLLDDFFQIG